MCVTTINFNYPSKINFKPTVTIVKILQIHTVIIIIL
jgi:hypothetical protein